MCVCIRCQPKRCFLNCNYPVPLQMEVQADNKKRLLSSSNIRVHRWKDRLQGWPEQLTASWQASWHEADLRLPIHLRASPRFIWDIVWPGFKNLPCHPSRFGPLRKDLVVAGLGAQAKIVFPIPHFIVAQESYACVLALTVKGGAGVFFLSPMGSCKWLLSSGACCQGKP